MAKPLPSKVLRVGVVHGGRIIEERLFRKPASITVGQGPKNTFFVPDPNLPDKMPVLEYTRTGYALVFTEDMDGRVRLGSGADVDFAALRAQGTASQRGDSWVLGLSDQDRGKITLGNLTLLFQFVVPPPEPTAAQLPASARGSFWSGVDRVFAGLLGTTSLFALTLAFTTALAPMPEEEELSLEELPDRYAKVMMPAKPPEPEKPADKPAANDSAKKDEKKAEKKPDEPIPAAKADATPAESAARKAAIQERVAQSGILKILGSNGGAGAGSAFADVLGSSSASNDISAALAGAGGVGVATSDLLGGPGGTGPRGGATGEVATIGAIATKGGGNVNVGEKQEVAVKAETKLEAAEVESSTVDREGLARYVKSRLKAITSCYEKELKRNPSLKGRVVVRFTIKPDGRTSDVDVEENTVGSDAVGACIKTLIRTWTFPFKPEEETTVAYPFVFSPAS